ncbi:hypothetical protein RND81_07G099900 [Saponaria officinalis]|uniref:non-specific serine/threonine protein kinase n=1 Tax=Saponaria officinalis TaxID=3572 RepID=A0AAW1JQ90_SAPOF
MSSPSPASSPPATSNSTTSPPPSTTVTPPPSPSTTTPPPSSTPSAPPPSTTPSPPAPPPSTPSTPSTPSSPPPTSSVSPPSPPSPSTPSTKSPPSPSSGGVKPSPTSPAAGGGGGKSPTSGNNNNDGAIGGGGGNSGISTGVVVGIAIAGVVVLIIVSIICVCCTKKKKRRRNDDFGAANQPYYVPPPPPKDGHYGVQAQQWQQNYPPPAAHYQIPKPPAPPTAVPPRPPPGPPRPPSPQPPPVSAPFISGAGGSGSSMGSESQLPPPSPGLSLGFSKSTFSYDELAMATDNFSEDNILGQGGFGYVHKGVLPNGKEVAVKSLKAGSGQGEREFQAEVEIISRVHHKHLVSLVGYCITGSHRLLVYEFVPNKTMEFHLHGKGRPTMDWPTRLRIALGSAKGLAYLHEDCHPKIIHRDIKAANILLNNKFEAMVADFGLAKLSSDVNTHVSTRVMGTFGYLAPEYAASGKLTDKSDVFSFGVMLLELITGRRPVDPAHTYADDSLVDWARPLLTRSLEENNFESLVDPRLHDYHPSEMARMVACAAACVRHSARRRPRMSQVVRALEGEVSLSDLNEGIRPGHSSMYSSYGSSDYETGQYNEDMKKFRQVALASQEYGSSEYGGTTSEYGLYPSGSSSEGPSRQTTREMELGKMKGDSRGFSGSSGV